jgi:pimeloyl-ACP methyl ester carboxylesterase
MRQEKICLKNGRGDTLSGVLHHPSSKKICGSVILCHGMDSSKNSDKLVFLAENLAAAGVLALRFDFAYVGESSGCFAEITCTGELEDLKAAHDFLIKLEAGKIAVFGSSLGGTIAVLFASTRPELAALATLAAPLHPEKFPRRMLTDEQLQDWRARGFTNYNGRRLNVSLLHDLDRLDLPHAARTVVCPALVLHGDADQIVPVEEAYELNDCLAGPKRLSILRGGDHRLADPRLMRRAMDESLDWLLRHLR